MLYQAQNVNIQIEPGPSNTQASVAFDLADYPISVPFNHKLPDRVIVTDNGASPHAIQSYSLHNSTVTVTYVSAPTTSVGLGVEMQFDV